MQFLSPEALLELTRDAETLEHDGKGPKVLRLQDGNILKLFRKRRLLSSETLKPYAKRFADNAKHLRQLGVPSPKVIAIYRLRDLINGSAVHYIPLPGETLRHALSTALPDERRRLVELFGQLLSQLHEHGVYFRSIHLGNVLRLPDNSLGLIDIADMSIRRKALPLPMRKRNLKHMRRYKEDSHWLFGLHKDALVAGYNKSSETYSQALFKSSSAC